MLLYSLVALLSHNGLGSRRPPFLTVFLECGDDLKSAAAVELRDLVQAKPQSFETTSEFRQSSPSLLLRCS